MSPGKYWGVHGIGPHCQIGPLVHWAYFLLASAVVAPNTCGPAPPAPNTCGPAMVAPNSCGPILVASDEMASYGCKK